MIRQGCKVIRLPRDRQSALALLDTFVKPDGKPGFAPVGRIGTPSALSYGFPVEITPSRMLQHEGNERKTKDLMRTYSTSVSTYLDFEPHYKNFRNYRQVKADIGSPVSEDLKSLQEVSGRKVTLTKQLRQFKEQVNEKIALVAASSGPTIFILVQVFPLGILVAVCPLNPS
jgi:hypothetical protein